MEIKNRIMELAGLRMKRAVKSGLRQLGLEMKWLPRSEQLNIGLDPYQDMRMLTCAIARPVIFDVGANVGQTVDRIRNYFDRPVIHAFEPSPDTFETLRRVTGGIPDLILNNVAVGRLAGTADLVENSRSDMSSLLEPGPDGWGDVKGRVQVPVVTLDQYRVDNAVERIDILKIDTQGFEMEVLHGAENSLRHGRIGAVFMEITFIDIYKGIPTLDALYRFMTERGFHLVAFYDFHYQNNRAGWCDAMFARNE